MAFRRGSDDTPIQPLLPLDESPPRRRHAPGRAAGTAALWIAGLTGLVLGFFLAGSFGPSAPENQVPATVPALAEDDITTTTSTTTIVPAPATLRDLAPTYDGSIYFVTGGQGGTIGIDVWTPFADGPRSAAVLPDGIDASTIAWDAVRSSVAALAHPGGSTRLYAGPADGVVPIADGDIGGFAWHDSRPRLIAWTSPGTAAGTLVTRFDLDRRAVEEIEVAVDGALVAWGDWGMLFSVYDGGPRLVTIDSEGAEVGRAAGTVAGRANTAYRDALNTGAGGRSREPVPMVDARTGSYAALEGPSAASLSTVVSPALGRVAWIDQTGARTAVLTVASLGGDWIADLDVSPARILDWTPDGRYLVVESLISLIDDDSIYRPFFLVDVVAGRVDQLPAGRPDVLAAALRAGTAVSVGAGDANPAGTRFVP